MSSASRTAISAALIFVAAAGSACGGDSEQAAVSAQEIQAAKQEGAQQARLEERQRQQRLEQQRLKREIAALKKQKTTASTTSSSSSTSNAPAPVSSLQGSSCGDNLSVGPNTTCAFARNVRDEYSSSGASTITVWSPVTQRSYTMSCAGSAVTVCTGGNNATVYFR